MNLLPPPPPKKKKIKKKKKKKKKKQTNKNHISDSDASENLICLVWMWYSRNGHMNLDSVYMTCPEISRASNQIALGNNMNTTWLECLNCTSNGF